MSFDKAKLRIYFYNPNFSIQFLAFQGKMLSILLLYTQ